MARPRKPTKILQLSGAGKRNPGRLAARGEEPEPDPGLGDPPEFFDEADRARWAELQVIVPAGVLTRMDRPAAELLCRLWSKSRRNELKPAQETLLASLFGKFGLTPSERSKVSGGPKDRKPTGNPFRHLA